MTTPHVPEHPQPVPRAAVLREVLALVLLVIGATAVGVAAFAVDWRLGTALVGVLALSLGLFLASDRRS